MKKSHIVAIILIAVAIAAIMATMADSSSYASFSKAASNAGREYHVVGMFLKDKAMTYDPEVDPNRFVFFMEDNEGVESKVVLSRPKPQDFERSEQVVVIGSMQEDAFYANDILMKCPSKYNDVGAASLDAGREEL